MVLGRRADKGIQSLKEAVANQYFHSYALTFVVTDTSPSVILLLDQGTGQHQPIAYNISRSFLPTQRRYSQIEGKELGCVWAMERLHNYLFGVKFTLLTDQPVSSKFDPHSSKVLPQGFSAWHGDCINMIFELRISREMLTQQTCCCVYLLSTIINWTVVFFVKITYSLFALEIHQICKLSLYQK